MVSTVGLDVVIQDYKLAVYIWLDSLDSCGQNYRLKIFKMPNNALYDTPFTVLLQYYIISEMLTYFKLKNGIAAKSI